MALNLAALQKQFWKQREQENHAFQKDQKFKDEQEKLGETYQSMNNSYKYFNNIRKNLNKTYNTRKRNNSFLQNYYKNPYNLVGKKKNTGTMRKRVNPEFARLGIPVPPSQEVGSALVPLGAKIKKNGGRRTRRHRHRAK